MSDLHHKMPKSRSRSGRLVVQENIIKLTRQKPVFIPKSIRFVRGPVPTTHQFMMDGNVWVEMPETLSKLMVREHSLIIDSKAQHMFPPTPGTSVAAFLTAFEIDNYDPEDIMKSEMAKCFTDTIRSLFTKYLLSSLLYEPEHTIEVLKTDQLVNTPAIFILRLLYFLPTLLRTENPDSDIARNLQEGIAKLIKFADENSSEFFILPNPYHKQITGSTAQKTAQKSDRSSHGHAKDRNY